MEWQRGLEYKLALECNREAVTSTTHAGATSALQQVRIVQSLGCHQRRLIPYRDLHLLDRLITVLDQYDRNTEPY